MEDSMDKLGKFKAEDLRNYWPNEARDFTPWLVEHIDELADAIHVDLIEVINTNVSVGKYFADILGKIKNGPQPIKVVIENQLEKSDHDHLGKILTYAAGVDAKLIIWICKEAEDEHRAAVDWLNENTDIDISLFLIKIGLWKIDDSRPALRFEIICSPNNWKGLNLLTGAQLAQLDFWTKYQNFLEGQEEFKKIYKYKIRKAMPVNWYILIIKPGKAYLSCTVSFQKNHISCDFDVEPKELYVELFKKKDEMNKALQLDLEWNESLLKKEQNDNWVRCYNKNIKLDKENFEECFQWLLETSMKYLTILPKYLE
jgi:hypothetical protein